MDHYYKDSQEREITRFRSCGPHYCPFLQSRTPYWCFTKRYGYTEYANPGTSTYAINKFPRTMPRRSHSRDFLISAGHSRISRLFPSLAPAGEVACSLDSPHFMQDRLVSRAGWPRTLFTLVFVPNGPDELVITRDAHTPRDYTAKENQRLMGDG